MLPNKLPAIQPLAPRRGIGIGVRIEVKRLAVDRTNNRQLQSPQLRYLGLNGSASTSENLLIEFVQLRVK